jgi:DNA-binding transcriptional LysR family regulator
MLKELKTFLAIGRHGTFSGAGQQLGLTQSAVSAQIQRLEEWLGFSLFDRVGRNARLNAAGRETLERAEQLVALFDGLPRPASQGAALLRIGAIASVQATGLPDALVALRSAHPQLRIKVVPGVSLALLGQVDAGELDAAVLIRPPFELPPGLTWRPLWSDAFVLVVPERVRGKDWRQILRNEPFLRYDRASFGGRQVAQFLEISGIDVEDAVEMDEISGLVGLVERGMGVALVPRTRPYFPLPAGVRAVSLGTNGLRREIGLVERTRHAQAQLVRELHEALGRRSRH